MSILDEKNYLKNYKATIYLAKIDDFFIILFTV